MTTPEAVNQVRELYETGEPSVEKMAEELLDLSLNKGSKDNISALLVKLPGAMIGPITNGGIDKRRLQRATANSDTDNSLKHSNITSSNANNAPWSTENIMEEET